MIHALVKGDAWCFVNIVKEMSSNLGKETPSSFQK